MKSIKLKSITSQIYFLLICSTCMISSCTKDIDIIHVDGRITQPLSSARNIAGTWKSLVPVNVYYLTNCNSSSISTYKTWQCKFTFVITAIDDNNVNVDISGDVYNVTNDNCSESPNIANGYPISFSGLISSSALTLTDNLHGNPNTDVGDFTFTTNLLSGKISWISYYSSQQAIGWKTDKISLTK